MRNVLQRTEVDPLVMPELLRGHVAVVLDDLPHVFRRHLFLLRLHIANFALRREAAALHLRPFLGLVRTADARRVSLRTFPLSYKRHRACPDLQFEFFFRLSRGVHVHGVEFPSRGPSPWRHRA